MNYEKTIFSDTSLRLWKLIQEIPQPLTLHFLTLLLQIPVNEIQKCYFIYNIVMIPPTFNAHIFKGRLLQDELKLPQVNGNSPVMPIPPSFSSPFCTNKGNTSHYTDSWMHLGLHGTVPSGVDFPLLSPSAPNASD
jgi:hypothetical protein